MIRYERRSPIFTLFKMNEHMLMTRDTLKIGDVIIRAISIYVMNFVRTTFFITRNRAVMFLPNFTIVFQCSLSPQWKSTAMPKRGTPRGVRFG